MVAFIQKAHGCIYFYKAIEAQEAQLAISDRAAWRRHGSSGSVSGGAQRDGGSAVAAARRLRRIHRHRPRCTDARAFERHQRADVRDFVLGRGRRDDSVDGIVVLGSDGAACGDVHRGCRCAAAADNDGDADELN